MSGFSTSPNWAAPGSIGATTPAAGAFTTLSASGLITATGGQIAFPASQNASANANTLDDYEEGTFTPSFTFATAGDLSFTYDARAGFYTKIGRQVTVTIVLSSSAFTHTTASGSATITGLPFTQGNATNQFAYGAGGWRGITKANYTDVTARVTTNDTTVVLLISGSGQALTAVTAADMPTGGTVSIQATIVYFV